MSESDDNPAQSVPPPPSDIRPTLVQGAAAALAAGALAVAASAVEAARGATDGLSVVTVLMLLAALPQVLVLRAFVRLAGVSGSAADHLRRSSVCLFGSGWLMIAVGVVMVLLPEGPATVVALIALGLGLALFYGYATRWTGMPAIVVLYVVVKYGGGWLLTGNRLASGEAFSLSVVVLLLASLVAYPTWFAVTLLRARGQFGPTAGALAGVVLLSVAAAVGFVTWFVITLVTAPGGLPRDEAALDELLPLNHPGFAVAGAVTEAAWAVATAAFLLSARHRVPGPTAD